MAWRFVPCFLAAIAAVGLSSGNLSSAETEKKDGEDLSGLERMKRSILWKQETFLVSNEKLEDSTSSEKAAKRRCKRDGGSGCARRTAKTRKCVGIPPPIIYTKLKWEFKGVSCRYPGKKKVFNCLVFDLGEKISGVSTMYWNPYDKTIPGWSTTIPSYFKAVLKVTYLHKLLERTLARETQFAYAPEMHRSGNNFNKFNDYRYLTLAIPKDLKSTAWLKLHITGGEDTKGNKISCEMTFRKGSLTYTEDTEPSPNPRRCDWCT